MTRVQDGTAGRPVRRGRPRWGLVLAIAGVPGLILVYLIAAAVKFTTSDYPLGGAPESAPCAEALEFGGARLPKGAYDSTCTVQVWLDTSYSAEFRMPRDEVDDWLGRTYPGVAQKTEFCLDDSAELCLSVGFLDGEAEQGQVPGTAYPGFGAHTTNVSIDYEDADTARVDFSAFTV